MGEISDAQGRDQTGLSDCPISFFTDEVAESVSGQIAFALSHGLDGIDLRNANGRNVIDLSPTDLEEILASGVMVYSIASPVNKVALRPELQEGEMEKLAKAIKVSHTLGEVPIRIFTPEPLPGVGEEETWGAIKDWMAPMVDLAGENGVTLLHENDAAFYGAFPERAHRLFVEFGSPGFRAVFDFANTVLLGFRPLEDWAPWILPHLAALHIKDAVRETKAIVPAGEGDGQMREFFALLAEQGWSGPISLEPHLSQAGAFSGKTAPDLGELAIDHLRRLLKETTKR